jgi:hypothetical protein
MGERQHWGTEAIISAPIRETGSMLVAEVNPSSSTKIVYKRNKETGQVWLNGHPFQSAPQMLSALSRLAALVELRSRR